MKKSNGGIRYIEEPRICRYYFPDFKTKKLGTLEKCSKGKWIDMYLNKAEYSSLYQQAKIKHESRKMGLRGKFLSGVKYVEIGLKEVQRVICDHLQARTLDFKSNKIWVYKAP